ncbi:hypothetical protein BKA69DRAFT_401566 [Paraphysoderma sedebokerense]|nr:hypothetical protein BKA69DRAFT_401566 [Paraphysoderma sedebokerense]
MSIVIFQRISENLLFVRSFSEYFDAAALTPTPKTGAATDDPTTARIKATTRKNLVKFILVGRIVRMRSKVWNKGMLGTGSQFNASAFGFK